MGEQDDTHSGRVEAQVRCLEDVQSSGQKEGQLLIVHQEALGKETKMVDMAKRVLGKKSLFLIF